MSTGHRGSPLVLAAALAIATIYIYLPAIVTGEFVYEDNSAIVQTVVEAHVPLALWRTRGVTRLSYRIDNWIGHGEPWAFHLTNVLLHLLNGLLVFLLVRRIGVGWTIAWLAVACFLLHPLQTEAVAYGAGRTELLSTAFVLAASLLAWHAPLRGWRVGLSGLCLLAGLSAKESSIAIVGCWIVYAAIFEPSWLTHRAVQWTLGCVLAVVAVFAVGVFRLDHFAQADLGRVEYAGLQAVALWRYLALVVWPVGLSIDHDFSHVTYGWRIAALVAAWMLAFIPFALSWSIADGDTRSTGRLWDCAAALPIVAFACAWIVAALVPRFLMRIPEVLNEHQMYLPMVGVSLLVGLALGPRNED